MRFSGKFMVQKTLPQIKFRKEHIFFVLTPKKLPIVYNNELFYSPVCRILFSWYNGEQFHNRELGLG